MNQSGNTILITGGGSGIGRGLAEAFLAKGNSIIIAGRRKAMLNEVTSAHPAIRSMTLDVTDPADIHRFAAAIEAEAPNLNVLINNAGIMGKEDLTSEPIDLALCEATIITNVLGPMRLTAALLPLLKRQQAATVMNVTSGLAFTPRATSPSYCTSKAALHSYSLSLRYQLQETSVEVIELIPPYVATELTGQHQAVDSRAMPLKDYIAEVMSLLEADPSAKEITSERAKMLRFSAETGKYDEVFQSYNDAMTGRVK